MLGDFAIVQIVRGDEVFEVVRDQIQPTTNDVEDTLQYTLVDDLPDAPAVAVVDGDDGLEIEMTEFTSITKAVKKESD